MKINENLSNEEGSIEIQTPRLGHGGDGAKPNSGDMLKDTAAQI